MLDAYWQFHLLTLLNLRDILWHIGIVGVWFFTACALAWFSTVDDAPKAQQQNTAEEHLVGLGMGLPYPTH